MRDDMVQAGGERREREERATKKKAREKGHAERDDQVLWMDVFTSVIGEAGGSHDHEPYPHLQHSEAQPSLGGQHTGT